jgi:hypothetical protein
MWYRRGSRLLMWRKTDGRNYERWLLPGVDTAPCWLKTAYGIAGWGLSAMAW